MTKKSEKFIDTPVKIGNTRDIKNQIDNNMLSTISTPQLLLHLLKRHKFGLVSVWAVAMTIGYLFPPAFDIIGSVIL